MTGWRERLTRINPDPDPPSAAANFTPPLDPPPPSDYLLSREYREDYIPYVELPVVSDVVQRQGEHPPVIFSVLSRHWAIPQVNVGIEFWRNLVIGTGVTINCLDDDAKAELEKWMDNTGFNDRMNNCVTQTLVYGIGCVVKIRKRKGNTGPIIGIEDMDVSNILWVNRDEYGNPLLLKRIYATQGTQYDRDVDYKNDVFLRFRPLNRSFFGMSRFHSISILQDDSNTTYKTLGDGIIAMNDAIIGTAEQVIYPLTFVEPKNKTREAMQQMKAILQKFRPRERIITKNAPEVKTAETQQNRVNYEPLIKACNSRVAESMEFPIEILSGDFTSRASSKTTDELFMRTVRTYQTKLAEVVREILVDVLLNHESGRWDEKAVAEMSLTINFDNDDKTPFTLEEMIQLFQAGAISLEEIRQYSRNRGQDLFTPDGELEADREKMMNPEPGGDPRQARGGAGGTQKTTSPSTTRSEVFYPHNLEPREDPRQNPKPNYSKKLKRPFISPTQKAAQDHDSARTAGLAKALKDQGKPALKIEYRSKNDSKTCKWCRALHGKRWWYNDGRRPTIPRHPNCRCHWIDVATGLNLGTF